ncbi:NUDIX domain-containing protein [uncultured Sphingomonas sp.]|uniref:NUDIX hydrolase n=1 Tax=uncultured Sphingomonas sp. TaxID=158754 RepID=UPI0025D5806C|nr:NUDIX domain-containing protein [uncultured Sphingomonas sp.]
MEEAAFLRRYDPDGYDRPSVAVDCVAFALCEGKLAVLLARRDQPPFAGHWALPGGFVGIDEPLEAAAERVLRDKAGLVGVVPEQVHCFGAVDRDPRMRIIAIAYRVLLDPARTAALTLRARQCLATIDPAGGVAQDGQPLRLAFDHDHIVRLTLQRLRATIDDAAFALLPDRFTLRELQAVHEAVLGRTLNKPAFRRRMLERGILHGTGDYEAGRAFRPAELYIQRPKG